MCSFGVTTASRSLLEANRFARLRGPDGTNTLPINGVNFLHNLLHITGGRTPQPFVKDDVVVLFNGEIYNYRELGNDATECLRFCRVRNFRGLFRSCRLFLYHLTARKVIDSEAVLLPALESSFGS